MNARMLTTATLFTAFTGVLTAKAADSQLLSMVMPDAKVVAGVNVDSAKASPFGMYVLTQMQSNDSELRQLIALTGFDPTRDVHEVLAATATAPGSTKTPSGLVLARGNFEIGMITTAATAKGATTETYNGATIIEDPKQLVGIGFVNSTLVAAGDIASVKAAIDRPSTGQSLPSGVLSQVSQWCDNDAWVITTVPLSALAPQQATTATATGGAPMMMAGLTQQVQQMAGGVKFGSSVVATAAIQADNAADATQLANTVQFMVNLIQMQSQKDPQLANVAQGFSVNTQGTTVNLKVTLPEAQFQQLFQMEKKATMGSPQTGVKKQ
jgi:hypothetical protein